MIGGFARGQTGAKVVLWTFFKDTPALSPCVPPFPPFSVLPPFFQKPTIFSNFTFPIYSNNFCSVCPTPVYRFEPSLVGRCFDNSQPPDYFGFSRGHRHCHRCRSRCRRRYRRLLFAVWFVHISSLCAFFFFSKQQFLCVHPFFFFFLHNRRHQHLHHHLAIVVVGKKHC